MWREFLGIPTGRSIVETNIDNNEIRISEDDSWGTQERRQYPCTHQRLPVAVLSEAFKGDREMLLWRCEHPRGFEWCVELIDIGEGEFRFANLFTKKKPSTAMLLAYANYKYGEPNASSFQRTLESTSKHTGK